MDYLDLNQRQQEVLQYIKKVQLQKGYPPTVREIGQGVGLKSPATVHGHLRALEEKGYIRRDACKQRALELTEKALPESALPEPLPLKEMTSIPLLGTIAAGQPLLADEQVEDFYPLPLDFVHSNKQLFMLRVQGESMIEAGIFNGDLLVVEQTPQVANGEIAAVLLEDSATVKYFYKEKDFYRLRPANSSMADIIAHEVQILGRVIALLRRF